MFFLALAIFIIIFFIKSWTAILLSICKAAVLTYIYKIQKSQF